MTQKEKDSRMKRSTVDDKCNYWVNKIYVGLLLLMLVGFSIFNFLWLLSTHDDTEEQILIERWLGDVAAIWWLLILLTALRIMLTVVFVLALRNFWKATGGEGFWAGNSGAKNTSIQDEEPDRGRDMIAERLKGGDERSQCSFVWHGIVYAFYVAAWFIFGLVLWLAFADQYDELTTIIVFIIGVIAQAVLLGSILYAIHFNDK